MVGKLKDGLEQLKYKWQESSSLAKKAIILFALSSLIVGGVVYYLVTKVEYGVLFSDLSSSDAGSISQDLKEQKIPYQLKDNGKTILIPQNQIDEYRIGLAVDNKLPDSSSGFELFDGTSIMTTDEDRKIMYQRALTGELERAILSLDGVDKVKVILVTPEDDLFSDSQKEATASIVLTLRKQLSDASIQGIVTLTVGAVENIKPENVKVVDSNGHVLADSSDEEDVLGNVNNKYMTIKRAYEDSLEKKIQRLLEAIYGPDKAKVSINVDLDFDSKESTRTTYANPEIRSENVQATGTGEDIEQAQTGQVNDNVSNVTGGENAGTSSYNRSVNNELDTEIVTTVSAPGTIRRMTSSIVISANIPADVRTELETLIASAVGFDNERGDTIAIQGMNFNVGEEETETTKGKDTIVQNLDQYIIYFVVAGIVTLFLVIGITIILLFKKKKQEEDYLVEEVEEPVVESKVVFAQEKIDDTTPADEEKVNEEEVQLQIKRQLAKEREQTQKKKDDEAKQYAGENPEVAAELIKAWLKDIK